MSVEFDVIPYDDLKGNWKELGAGSFGKVYKGQYLGIDVAIKEVLPSNDYDVSKYFEREWRLMREARHPNVVLYLGLSRAPAPDGRIFIVSEFIENGNLRQFIWDKRKPLPWRLRMSFAVDVTRAMAYLHARNCVHRDLKPENLLVTANGRLKVTDFGFARIVAQTEEESRRLTFCGTDAYMSPEILLSESFGMDTDVYSLGVIFCELLARKLADDQTFKRYPPFFNIDPEEVRSRASEGCPPAFIDLAVACCSSDRTSRPTMVEILNRLRAIEAEVIANSKDDAPNIGSIKFLGSKTRPAGRRMPSFGQGVKVGKAAATPPKLNTQGLPSTPQEADPESELSEDEEDEEIEAILASNGVNLRDPAGGNTGSWRIDGWMKDYVKKGTNHSSLAHSSVALPDEPNYKDRGSTISKEPLLGSNSAAQDSSSTIFSSGMTVRQGETTPPTGNHHHREPNADLTDPETTTSVTSNSSYYTASNPSLISGVSAILGSHGNSTQPMSDVRPTYAQAEAQIAQPRVHRFTLVKSGSAAGRKPESAGLGSNGLKLVAAGATASSWSPLEYFFGSALGMGAKCDLCTKRLGWKPVLECDDCGLKAHMKCAETAPMDCGEHEYRTHSPPRSPISPRKANRGK